MGYMAMHMYACSTIATWLILLFVVWVSLFENSFQVEIVAVFLSRVLQWNLQPFLFFFFQCHLKHPKQLSLISRLSMEQARSAAAWGLAEKELILFMADPRVLCFGFMTKAVLLTHQCFSHSWAVLTHC